MSCDALDSPHAARPAVTTPGAWPYETAGQRFVRFLRVHHIGDEPWEAASRALVSTGRGTEWAQAIQEMAVLHLARRLIAAGCAIVDSRADWDIIVDREIKQMIVDTMVVDYFLVNEIHSRLVPAVRAARRGVSAGVRTQLTKERHRVAPWCYLCGTDLDFDTTDAHTSFTLDHVWPQAYGGDSDPENLLQACKSCNERKGNVASWALYPIQALVAGYQLNADDLSILPKEMRFAVQTREAAFVAVQSRLSLKDAFATLGRPDLPSVVDESVSVDVFNLQPQFR